MKKDIKRAAPNLLEPNFNLPKPKLRREGTLELISKLGCEDIFDNLQNENKFVSREFANFPDSIIGIVNEVAENSRQGLNGLVEIGKSNITKLQTLIQKHEDGQKGKELAKTYLRMLPEVKPKNKSNVRC